MRKNYGLPYQGSKNQIAEEIIDFLPLGNRLVDLFGGGGAISHCASLSGKYQSVLYNEINPLVVKAFTMAINGEFDKEDRWINKEEFHRLKTTDPYVAFCFSFSNTLGDYAFGEENEKIERAVFYSKVQNNNSLCEKLGISAEDFSSRPMNRLKRIQSLKGLTNIEITEGSYEEYAYKPGDIVYCDPPYENYRSDAYGRFDSQKFYDWVASRPYQVFFSSYNITDSRFKAVWQKDKRALTSKERYLRTEYIYSNQPYQKKNSFVFGI